MNELTEALRQQDVPYDEGRLWNKNMVARILADTRYTGEKGYGGQFKEILDEQTLLKERRSGILADNNEQAKANQRIMDAAQTLKNASLHITEWDESAVRQLVETVKVLSKDEIAVTLKGGIEIRQKIMY